MPRRPVQKLKRSAVKLGPFELEHPAVLAPMAGITDSPFRRLMRRLGSPIVISELVSANGIEHGGEKTIALLRFHEEERPVGIQIFSEDTSLLCKAAQKIEKLGADFVDLNLGCPVPKVVKRGAGSALCRDPIALGKLLTELVNSVQIPVTIKIRTGWDATSRNALECVRAATDAGVRWVAIHGRTRAQGYSGEADWDFISEIKAKSSIPIIGNGDLATPEMALDRLKSSGVDAVMVGRAALRNPFFFEQVHALWRHENYLLPSAERYLEILKTQRLLFEEAYSPRTAMLQMRKFLAWFSAGYPGCHDFRRKVFSMTDFEALWQDALLFFETQVRDRDLRFMAQPFLMGGHG